MEPMTEQELIEALADKEHASWARWMLYLFSKCETRSGGGLIIPTELVARWERQAHTPYARLSEQEKQSDRDEVAHILPIIRAYAEDQAPSARPSSTALTIDASTASYGEIVPWNDGSAIVQHLDEAPCTDENEH